MKMKRILACTLTMLLMFSFLPVSAMAENVNDEFDVTLSSDYDVNNGYNVTVSEGATVGTNNGDVRLNNGTVTTNNYIIETNSTTGTVTTNDGDVYINNGTVTTNNDTVGNEYFGNPVDGTGNYGTVTTNNGKIVANSGTVGAIDESGNAVDGTGNYGYIYENLEYGTVVTNSGYICFNYGEIETNETGGSVGAYENNGEIFAENEFGNYGTITTNNGNVGHNGYFDGSDGKIESNTGTVVYNHYNSTIENNSGTVSINYGTVENLEGGTLYDVISTGGIEAITGEGTYYGINIAENYIYEDGNYVRLSGSALLQRQENDEIDLSELFTYDGYEITGYYDYYDNNYNNSNYVGGTTYTVNTAPTYLQLIWSKIKAIITSDPAETEPVLAYDLPDSVAAGDVQIGTDVKINGVIFRVIDMDDDSITVVTMCALSDEDYADPMAFLAKYLSAQQLELLLNSPERISDELASQLFGGNTEHLIFKAAKNLFE